MDMPVQRSTRQVADAIRRSIESRDGETLSALYAEGCDHTVVNRNAPPSRPLMVRGHDAIRAMWMEACARDMTHKVETQIAEDRQIATRITCRYPDGTKVACIHLVEVADGRIQRSYELDCWDE